MMVIMITRMKIDDSEVDGEVEDIGNYFMAAAQIAHPSEVSHQPATSHDRRVITYTHSTSSPS